jgi:diaminohydroxyphosphoribosylaminopyrimidine deaminase/5-amino-6-(5-phosphoribosylamino)uracil reductase
VIECEAGNGRPAVASLLAELGRRRMTNVLVEGGAEAFGSFLDARLIDEVHIFIAPKLLGGQDAKPVAAGLGPAQVRNAWPLADWTYERIGVDLYVRGRLPAAHALTVSD